MSQVKTVVFICYILRGSLCNQKSAMLGRVALLVWARLFGRVPCGIAIPGCEACDDSLRCVQCQGEMRAARGGLACEALPCAVAHCEVCLVAEYCYRCAVGHRLQGGRCLGVQ